MSSFTTVLDELVLFVPVKDTEISIAISGTYAMTILFQVELGSLGSGAWQTIETFNTEDATEASTYVTKADNENIRLVVSVDTSGTAVATLTDNEDKDVSVVKDMAGNKLVSFKESGMVLHGTLQRDSDNIVNVAADVALTAKAHAGRTVVLGSATGDTATLPAATGTGNRYRVYVGTTVTSNSHIIQVANATDIMAGIILLATDTGGITIVTASTSDTITMNGSTTGGVKGTMLEFVDVAAGVFAVSGQVISTGAESTPFSAAVS